ncbi:MAG: tetratricopeptide repeat protein [Oscillospiraceae bacterium]|nr:tetratricopeptide repeat protein [Oscillospiraceae bacterium]
MLITPEFGLKAVGILADVAGLGGFVNDLKSKHEKKEFCKSIKKTAIKACKEYSKIINPQNKDIGFDAEEHGAAIADGILDSLRGGDVFTHETILKGNENFSDTNRKELYERIVNRLRSSIKYVELSEHIETSERLKRLEEVSDMGFDEILALLKKMGYEFESMNGRLENIDKNTTDILAHLEHIAPSKRYPKVVTRESAPTPSHYFVGREAELADIKHQLADNRKLMLVNGMGGIGKSEICKKLFHELDVPHVGWVVFDGNIQKTLHGKFTAIDETDFDENVRKTVVHINELGAELLLFIDNMNVPSEEDWRTIDTLSCNIIITSRLTDVDRIKPITIGKLSEELCVSLYKDILGRSCDDEIVNELVKKADYLTIVVGLLAKTARESGDSDSELLDKLNKCGFSLHEITDDVDGKTFKQHMQKLFDVSEVKDEDEFHILKMFSLFPPIPLDAKIAKRWFDLPNLNVLNRLAKRGWLFKSESGFYMHHVISDIVRFENMPTYDDCAGLVDKINEDLRIGNKVFTTLLGILPFAVNVARWLEGDENSQREDNFATLLSRIANLYDEQGKYDTALEYQKKDLDITITVYGTNHPSTAASYNNIAYVYDSKGDYDKALEYYNKALMICEKFLGTDHLNTATTYNNIASVHDNQGDYVQALDYYNKALTICEKVLGTDHLDTATTYNNIGNAHSNQGDYDKAWEYHDKALTIHEKVLGTDHPNTAMTYNNIGEVYRNQGYYDKALEYYNKALTIREKVLGTDHPDTATSYNNIGLVYNNQGDYDKALEYYNKALTIREKVLGTDHPSTATTYNNIGGVRYKQGDYVQALEYFLKSYKIYFIMLPENHPYTLDTYEDLKRVFQTIHPDGDFEDWLTAQLGGSE